MNVPRLSSARRPSPWLSRRSLGEILVVLSLSVVLPLLAEAAEESDETPTATVEVGSWLVAGPVPAPMPAFAEEVPFGEEDPLKPAALLPERPRDPREAWPAAGAEAVWPGGERTAWRSVSGAAVDLAEGGAERPRIAYLASYVEVDRFVEATLEVASGHLLRVFVDGEQVAEKSSADEVADEEAEEGDEGDEAEEGSEEAEEDEREEAAEEDEAEEAVEAEEREEAEETEEAEPPGAVGPQGDERADEAEGEGAGEDEPEEGAEDDSGPGTASAEIELTTGKHLVLVVALLDPEGPAEWTVSAELEVPEERAAGVVVSASPERGVRIADLLDTPGVEAVDVSADGELVAVTLQRPQVPADDRVAWVEILRASDGAPVRTIRLPGSVQGFSWAPTGRRFAYRTLGDGGAGTIWLGDLADGSTEPLAEGVEGLGGLLWAPDGRSLLATISEEAEEEDDRGAVRVRSMQDRWAGFRDLDAAWQISTADGSRRRLTAGARGVSLLDVSPDGGSVLVSRTRYGLERPFATGELYELDLGTLTPRKVVEGPWLGGAAYSPDGKTILVTAGPSAFGELGKDVPEGTIPNEYDGQVYLVDRASGDVRAVTRDFDPAVEEAAWSHHDGAIYLRVTEGERAPLYRLDPASGRLETLEVPLDSVDGFALARRSPALAYHGSSMQSPAQVYAARVGPAGPARRGARAAATASAARRLLLPGEGSWEQVRFGRVEDFDFTTPDGTTIPGRLYYPLGFDPAAEPDRKVPLIVYYYGGVVPTGREFGGRYPKNLWAARGYAVYVLQPSGAVGFGQEFSARHVNDWGKRTSEEILQGVREVLAAHPFLDGSKVGNFGGSYGGFMTMLLLTKSDAFAAAISHAGISDITSYWGAGWWGYLYSAVAGAGSYPWTDPDLYVRQSPLYAADEIDTPLLLLHGTADPNVPPGESDQMFAALRVLGKEVEYIRIEGEAHWILTYSKRVLWWETILAWFDKHLKGQPEHWEGLWGEDLDRTGP